VFNVLNVLKFERIGLGLGRSFSVILLFSDPSLNFPLVWILAELILVFISRFQYFVFDFHMPPVMLFDKIITLSVSFQSHNIYFYRKLDSPK